MSDLASSPIVVCLGYPALQSPAHVDRIKEIDARYEPVALPVDANTDWVTEPPEKPFAEPPPWALGVAQQRRTALSKAEVLIALHTSQDLMTLCPALRWVQGVGAGVEQFSLAGVRRDQVVVTNASGISAGSMAEFVIGRLLSIWKRVREADQYQQAHEFIRTYGRTFAGSTVGIVGMGHIGDAVGQRARALGARVLGLKRSYRAGATSEFADELFGPSQLHAMLSACDSVVIAAPATNETYHLIDAAALAAMKQGAVLVNVARGSLVDEGALIDALRSQHIGAAVLDVFETEPLPEASPLWDLPNVYVSAHSSVSVDRYMADVFDLFVDNLTRYARGESLRNLVDMKTLGFS
jgi:phosphoglycerate dehydrogenase-like enzyme